MVKSDTTNNAADRIRKHNNPSPILHLIKIHYLYYKGIFANCQEKINTEKKYETFYR